MNRWLRQHTFALGEAVRQLLHAPGSFLFNVLVIAIALALPVAGLTLLENVQPVSQQLAVEPEISLFLAMDTPREQALALEPKIRSILQADRSKIAFIPREKALTALKGKTSLNDALSTLGANPLPDAYVLKLAQQQAGAADAIAKQLRALPGIETVQLDSAWVQRLAALMNMLRLALLLLAATLGVVVVAVIFNTIRLQVLTRHEEIAVSRLLGATDSFIHRPFYYSGALLGLGAGALALGAVALALQPLNDAVAEFARLYASTFQLMPLAASATALLLAASTLLGLLAAILSVKWHLVRLG